MIWLVGLKAGVTGVLESDFGLQFYQSCYQCQEGMDSGWESCTNNTDGMGMPSVLNIFVIAL